MYHLYFQSQCLVVGGRRGIIDRGRHREIDTVRVDSGTPHSSNYRIVPINSTSLTYCILVTHLIPNTLIRLRLSK
jgi:hypothetical protein